MQEHNTNMLKYSVGLCALKKNPREQAEQSKYVQQYLNYFSYIPFL